LFRNEGGSFGITFANTMLAQRAQFHQSILAQHLNPDNSAYHEWLQHIAGMFTHAGYSAIEAANRAQAQLYALLNQQASLLSYLDCFVSLVLPAGVGLILAMSIKNFRPPQKQAPAH
jgi:MFS transporter, DHA2 family, multidrug resistance protein